MTSVVPCWPVAMQRLLGAGVLVENPQNMTITKQKADKIIEQFIIKDL